MSMGGGQNDDVLEKLREAAEEGLWIYLENIHLVISWLLTLEKVFRFLQPKKGLRLWLITKSHEKFPVILLSTRFKIAYESPHKIKKNLERTTRTGLSRTSKGISKIII